jgi:hypothetical protein
MRDQLVRYLLGELNPQEQEQLEAELRDSPELQRELAYLQACLPGGCEREDDLEDEDFSAPIAAGTRSGLCERTLGRICGDGACDDRPRDGAEIAAAYDAPTCTPSWSLADLTVAGGVFLAISMLFLPALRQSRDAARRNNCADNMRQLGVMLVSFADQHCNFFPISARHENAGMFAVHLLEDGYAGQEELSELLLCRSSPIAEAVDRKQLAIFVPNMCDLSGADCKQRCAWKKTMGGSYAYQFGYMDEDRYCAIRNEGSCRKAILADGPSNELEHHTSANHGGCGQNTLFQDCHVAFVTSSTLPEAQRDLIYLNDAGQEAAGLDRFDTVLGRSDATPASTMLIPTH